MFGCDTVFKISTSAGSSRKSSTSWRWRSMILIATGSPVARFCAAHTVPNPPRPSNLPIEYSALTLGWTRGLGGAAALGAVAGGAAGCASASASADSRAARGEQPARTSRPGGVELPRSRLRRRAHARVRDEGEGEGEENAEGGHFGASAGREGTAARGEGRGIGGIAVRKEDGAPAVPSRSRRRYRARGTWAAVGSEVAVSRGDVCDAGEPFDGARREAHVHARNRRPMQPVGAHGGRRRGALAASVCRRAPRRPGADRAHALVDLAGRRARAARLRAHQRRQRRDRAPGRARPHQVAASALPYAGRRQLPTGRELRTCRLTGVHPTGCAWTGVHPTHDYFCRNYRRT